MKKISTTTLLILLFMQLNAQSTLTLYLKTFCGSTVSDTAYIIGAEPSDNIEAIKDSFFQETGIPSSCIQNSVYFGGQVITDGNSLSDYNIQDESTLFVEWCNFDGVDTVTTCSDQYQWIDGNIYTMSIDTVTHTISGGGINGCDSIVTLDLTINSVSDISTTIDGFLLTANNTNATYQWLDCDNNFTIIDGKTEQSFTATSSGSYAVEITENNCVDTSACVVATTVGILERESEYIFQLYPNPNKGNFTIDLNAVHEDVNISISDVNGRIIQSSNFKQVQKTPISFDGSKGVYLLLIKADNKTAVIRLVKK